MTNEEYIKREDVLKIVRDMRDLARADVLKDAITKIEELPALSAPEREKPTAPNRYVFEFNDKDNSRTWHIICYDGVQRYSCKDFSCDDSYWDDADDYVKEFLRNGGTHYKYNIPWNMYRDINKGETDGIYVLPNKPLSNLEEYRVYSDLRKEEREKETPKAYFVDSAVSKNCKNLSESYGEICVKCNKCGRFGEG